MWLFGRLFIMRLLPNYLTFILSIVFDIVVIIVVLLGLAGLFFRYKEMQQRNPLNYDEINFHGPELRKIGIPTSTPAPTPESGYGPFGCIGPQCCGPNTAWDEKNAVCKSLDGSDAENAEERERRLNGLSAKLGFLLMSSLI